MLTLNQSDQIKKLNHFTKKAKDNENSDNNLIKLGIVVYAASVDFTLIQAARLAEQIILKCQLVEGKVRSKPHEDNWFFDKQIRSRRITSEIKKLLPFKAQNDQQKENLINEKIKNFLSSSNQFLTQRNKVFHHLLSSKGSIEEIEEYINNTIKKYKEFEKTQKEFFDILQPYRFSEKEIQYFYKNSNS